MISGWFEPSCPSYSCYNCAPLIAYLWKSSNDALQMELKFGGFATVRGSLYSLFQFSGGFATNLTRIRTIRFSSVSFENDVTITVITQVVSFEEFPLFSFVPVSYENVGPSLSVSFYTTVAKLQQISRFELR